MDMSAPEMKEILEAVTILQVDKARGRSRLLELWSREAEDRAPLPPVSASYLPSLHLSVANGCRRLGDLDRARRHVLFASRRIGALANDAYGNVVRGGLRRLQAALAIPDGDPSTPSAATRASQP